MFAFFADIQDYEPIPKLAAVRMIKEPSGPTAIGTCNGLPQPLVRRAPDLPIQADTGGSLLRQQETLQPCGPMLWLEMIIEPYLKRQLLRRLQDIQQRLQRETALAGDHADQVC